ncbi:MAG: hypothetical protein E6G39_17915 [Actinobacteria bacterium]|nr:MAG: hypothetical protein E6G39_17915 [Actinomycetota bacterium]
MRTRLVTSHCGARYATRTSVTLANFVNSGRANENRCHAHTRSTPRKRPRGANGELRFYDPNGQQLRNRSALAANGGVDALRHHHQNHGLDIGPDTIIGNYHGDHLDLAYATSELTRPERPTGDTCSGQLTWRP